MKTIPGPDWTVRQTLRQYPEAASVFIQLKTNCVGCLLARFCTLQEVERDFHLQPGDLVQSLREFCSKSTARS